MLTRAWLAFEEEIARWREDGRVVEFWWRDDDAGRRTQPLSRLLALAEQTRVPLALAVVPAHAEAALFADLPEGVDILQHGAEHRNWAAQGEKKTEFPSGEPTPAALSRLIGARATLAAVAPGHAPPVVLAPPWNRLAHELIPELAAAGYRGLSRYGARACAEPTPGLRQINTHVDLIAWRGDHGFVGVELALRQAIAHLGAKRTGRADALEPTGWLTHHACHDEAAWAFLERLLEVTHRVAGVRWRRASEVFLGTGDP